MGKKHPSSQKQHSVDPILGLKQQPKVDDEKMSVIAIDTSIFIPIAQINPTLEPGQKKQGFYQSIRDMKRLAMTGKLKFVITPSVLKEIVYGWEKKKLSPSAIKNEEQFIRDYCYIYEPKNPEQFAKETLNLACAYIKKGLMSRDKDKEPLTDAIVLAESTILGLNLVSANYTDFENYIKESQLKFSRLTEEDKLINKNQSHEQGARAEEIEKFNERHGFVSFNGSENVALRPYSSSEFWKYFRSRLGAFRGPVDIREKIKSIDENNSEKKFSLE